MPVAAPLLRRVPVWAWRAFMAQAQPIERRRFSADPIASVVYDLDLDYVGDGIRAHRLDVIRPRKTSAPLPVYVYFHGGGWTSGDKAVLTRYCARQAEDGMVVVNVNYRTAPRASMRAILEDGNAALAWVAEHAAAYGGDPDRMVLGGDSAGGQLAALLAQLTGRAELAAHWGLTPALTPGRIRGIVQHCSAIDFSVILERGFIMGLGFVRMLLPDRGRVDGLARASRFLSPIEWLWPGHPPVLLTTSRRDFFYQANLNFIAASARHGVTVDAHIDDRALHTWQQDTRNPASAAVYERLQAFVRSVTSVTGLSSAATDGAAREPLPV